MADYPIIFRTTNVIECAKFKALVVADGRILMSFEDGEWHCHGVEPGGLTESGSEPREAFDVFRSTFRRVLNDLAEEASSAEEFQRRVQMFFATDEVEQANWVSTLKAWRAELSKGTPLEAPFSEMERLPPRESAVTINVLETYAPMPKSDEEEVAFPVAA